MRLLNQHYLLLDRNIKLKLKFENEEIEHTFFVYDKIKHDCILGLDFCTKTNVKIEFKKLIVRLLESDIELNEENEVFLKNDVKIPREADMSFVINLRENKTWYWFKPTKYMFERYTLWVNSSEEENDQSLEIIFHNPKIHEITLNKNIRIGKLVEVNTYKDEEEGEDYDPFKHENDEEDFVLLASEEQSKEDFISKLKIIKQSPEILELLIKYRHLFADSISQLKIATNIKHIINTGYSQPIRSVPYRVSPAEKAIIKTQIEEMLKYDIIEPSFSPWSSPIVLVKKPDGSTRFCVDYRKLNAVTVKDSHPIPLINDTLDALSGSKIYTKLDLKAGYWSISMDEKSKEKTAFCSFMGLYQFKRLAFGLVTAPSSFQRYVTHVLSDLLWKFCLVYIDDIIIWSTDEKEHVKHVEQVLERLDKHNLRLNTEKCEFSTDEVTYLGHIVSYEGIKPDSNKVKAVEEFPTPIKVRNIREFLGLTSYYRKFIKDYAKIAKPLNNLLRKNTKFIFDNECKEAFEALKLKLITPPILGHFIPGDEIILYTDASNYAMGCILSQQHDQQEVVICYNSKSLDDRQSKYSVCEKEALAIVWAVKKLRHYLYGGHFTIKSDNCAVCYLMSLKNPNGRLIRWGLLLSEFDFTIQFKSGKSHSNVDCLSRNPVEGPEANLEELLLIEDIDIAGLQKSDDWCKGIIEDLKQNTNLRIQNSFKIENDVLYKISQDPLGNQKLLLCVPLALRKRVLEELHDDVTSGHLGVLKTYTKVRNRFFWKNLERTVRKYVKRCEACQKTKSDAGLMKGNLQPIEYPSAPFSMVGIDLMGSLTLTTRRNRYIIVLIDFFTKYVEAEPLKNMRSQTIADWFVNKIVMRYGAVDRVLTDQGKGFCSTFMESVFALTKSQHVKATPYHPETNGLAERSIRTIRSMMGHYVNESFTNWDLYLNKLIFAYNSAVQVTTGESPYKLLFGREPKLPIDVTFKLPNQNRFLQMTKDSYDECVNFVRIRVSDAQSTQKKEYDIRHRDVSFEVNDLIGVRTPKREKGKSTKLFPKFSGPYKVTRVVTPVTYEVKPVDSKRGKPMMVHVQRIKKWNSEIIKELDN